MNSHRAISRESVGFSLGIAERAKESAPSFSGIGIMESDKCPMQTNLVEEPFPEASLFRQLAESSLYQFYQCVFVGGFGFPLWLIGPEEKPGRGQDWRTDRHGGETEIYPVQAHRAGGFGEFALHGAELDSIPRLSIRDGSKVAVIPVCIGTSVIAWLATCGTDLKDLTPDHFGRDARSSEANITSTSSSNRPASPRSERLSFESAVELLELIGTYIGGEMNEVVLKHTRPSSFNAPECWESYQEKKNRLTPQPHSSTSMIEVVERKALERVRHELLFDGNRPPDDATLTRISGFATIKDFRSKFRTYFHESPQCYRRRLLDCHRKMEAWKPYASIR